MIIIIIITDEKDGHRTSTTASSAHRLSEPMTPVSATFPTAPVTTSTSIVVVVVDFATVNVANVLGTDEHVGMGKGEVLPSQ